MRDKEDYKVAMFEVLVEGFWINNNLTSLQDEKIIDTF